MPKRSLFESQAARQTFWLLMIGVLIIYGAGIYLSITYIQNRYIRVTPRTLEHLLLRAVSITRYPPKQTPREVMHKIRHLHRRGFRFRISKDKQRGAVVLATLDKRAIAKLVQANKNALRVSIPINQGDYWVNIRGRVVEHQWLLFGFILTTVITFAALVLLCFWTVRRLAIPVDQLTEAAKRFGVDVQAPPMAEVGTPEMQQVIKAFNEMQGRIRRLIHDRTNMLAAISHDLRSPITRLQLRAEYLKGTPQYDKAIADLEDMERMITSILSFARDHRRSEAAEKFDLNALLESLCHDISDSGHEVVYSGSEKRLPFYGRLSAIKRALTNLIENAVKYGDKAEVTLQQQGNYLQVRIHDEGPGIPADSLDKVFEPFYRVDAARTPSKSGVGLGLAVARDIIVAHGGDISLLNREPRGLTVLVSLPVEAAI